MTYLFIDTATHDLTIAIVRDNTILALAQSNNTNEHSKYALTELEKVFEQAYLKPQDVDKVMVVNGPGSFTGVRIGVTIAKTYAWTLKKEITPVSSLLAHVLGYSGYDYYVSVIDARRGNVYAGIYDKDYSSVIDEQYISIDNLNDIISKLEGNIIVIGDLDIDNINPLKVDVLKIVEYYKENETVTPHALNPKYLKRVEAEEKLMEANV